MLQKIYLFILSALLTLNLSAQVGSGSLKGKITEQGNGEPLSFINVSVKRNGTLITGGQTDIDGNYFIKPLDPGSYDVEVSAVGFTKSITKGVLVNSERISFLNIKLSQGVSLTEVKITAYKVPLIEKDGGTITTVTAKDIAKMGTRSAEGVAATIAGVGTAGTDGEVSIRGARTGGSIYYIDGIKVRGSNNIPKSSIEEVSVIAGGLPANYGDVTSGIISITTKGPSSTFYGGIEAVTSGFKSGNGAAGLDKFGYNLAEASLSGPILFKRDKDGNALKDKPLLGFFAALTYNSEVDGRPSSIGYSKITDDALARLSNNYIYSPGGTAINQSAQELQAGDFGKISTSQNTGRRTLSGSAKLDVTTTPTINLSFGGSFNYSKGNNYSFANTLFNSANNSQFTNFDWRTYARFTQRFVSAEDSKSNLKRAYYSVLVDYSRVDRKTENAIHKDNFFDYGYVGKFDRLKGAPAFDVAFDDNGEYRRQSALPGDTLVIFTPGMKNEVMSAITSEYFSEFNNPDGNYRRIDDIRGRGLLNGDAPTRVYGLFNAFGTSSGAYQVSNQNQFRISASGSADLGKHAVSVGFEYEQRSDKQYTLQNLVTTDANRANNIWNIGRLLANNHLTNIDYPVYKFDSIAGVPVYQSGDSTVTVDDNGLRFVTYQSALGTQSTFDAELRKSLGLAVNDRSIINLDAVDPANLSVKFFSADELLNSGNALVGSFGYDFYGNKLKSRPTFDDFFTGKDARGNLSRLQAAFEPIYFSGYIMDKFAFEDIIFNVGLRVDRYDANQKVLKDKYSLVETLTVGDVGSQTFNDRFGITVPGNISSTAVVYVDDIKNPGTVIGFREGNNFYTSEGKLTTAKLISNASSGSVKPLRQDANSTSSLESGAFKDYVPQVNLMPRVSFSFPVSDEALFFAHYDVLTRRPNVGNRLDLVRYNFLNNVGSSAANPLNNPDLKPEKTIDYELGFQQVLTKASSLKLSAFYRENRDQIQVYQNLGSYPQDYYSYDNLDFGTTKGMSLTYDLRRTGNVSLRLNYTLQFAEGTGSAAGGSVVNLNSTDFSSLRTISPVDFDQRHKINAVLDYRYGTGTQYDGPKIGDFKVLEGMGANFTLNLGSGTPYSGSTITYDIINSNPRLNGSINGERLPWQSVVVFQLDRDIPLTFKKGEDGLAKKGNLNVYLLVNNLLNSRNILNVYRATGNPTDDGFLADARNQAVIQAKQNELAYRNYYNLFLQNPNNYSGPRTIRLGVKLDF